MYTIELTFFIFVFFFVFGFMFTIGNMAAIRVANEITNKLSKPTLELQNKPKKEN